MRDSRGPEVELVVSSTPARVSSRADPVMYITAVRVDHHLQKMGEFVSLGVHFIFEVVSCKESVKGFSRLPGLACTFSTTSSSSLSRCKIRSFIDK